ncbi:DUF4124 domain-containing protein [Pseudoxanthomonas sp. USHLN014]|uniref:DUF4124 domain-containing protein n=1 Tax=Pseudoxanthomonas sp. USHLN014 TaxID=3081297 RepID=UPI00301DDD2D
MKRSALAAVAVLAFVAGGAHAQAVYKCKGKDGGTAYQSSPCSPDAQPVKVQGTRAATLTEGEIANRQAVFKSTDLSSAGIAEQNCLSAANSRIYGSSNQRVAEYQAQISRLNARAARANNNLAGATFESGLRTQIASLQQSIAQERSAADTSMNAERQRCGDQRAEAERAIEKRYAPAH